MNDIIEVRDVGLSRKKNTYRRGCVDRVLQGCNVCRRDARFRFHLQHLDDSLKLALHIGCVVLFAQGVLQILNRYKIFKKR